MNKIKEERPIVLIKKLRQLEFSDADIEKILKVIDETCNACWDYDTTITTIGGCTCEMDW